MGFYGILIGFYCILMGFYGILMGFNGIYDGYPPVNAYIAMERSTMLLMGKSTISMAILNSYVSLPEGSTQNTGWL